VTKQLTDDELRGLCARYRLDGIIVIGTRANPQEVLLRATALDGSFAARLNAALEQPIHLTVRATMASLEQRTPLIWPGSNGGKL